MTTDKGPWLQNVCSHRLLKNESFVNIDIDSKIIIYENEEVLLIYIQLPRNTLYMKLDVIFFPKANKKNQKSRAWKNMMKFISLGSVFIYLLSYHYQRGQGLKIGRSFHEEVCRCCWSQQRIQALWKHPWPDQCWFVSF